MYNRLLSLILVSSMVYADDTNTIGTMASTLTNQFSAIASLMVAVAYVAGIGFGITSVFKFKQHKDNPTQVPIGTPFAMMAISVVLIFLPALYGPAGASIFGDGAKSGSASGDLSGLPGTNNDSATGS